MRTVVAATVACLSLAGLSVAADVQASIKKNISIPAGGLGPALQTLSQERHVHIIFVSEDVHLLSTTGVSGSLTVEETLQRLLQGTGLTYQYIDAETVSILPATVAAPAGNERTRTEGAPGRFRLAQASGVESATEDSARQTIDEIIVTATKRQERAQDIPISIAVIGNQDIERRGLIGMEDYLRSIPGVNQIDNGPMSNSIVIRGITTGPSFENFSAGATVASYFGESALTAGMSGGFIDVRPVDIDRIEVLRGPQGTTFGSSSLGGTLRTIPVEPKLDSVGVKLAASGSHTSGSGGDNSMIQGVVNIPLIADTLAVRAVGYRYDESGFYRNSAGIDPQMIAIAADAGLGGYGDGHVRDDVGALVSIGGRLSALWKPTDALSVSLNYLTQKDQQDGAPVGGGAGPYGQTYLPIAPQARVRGEDDAVADLEVDLLNLVVNYDLGWGTVTSAFSRVESEAVSARDLSGFFLFPISTTARGTGYESSAAEVRLASQLEGRFQFLGGLYYEDTEDGQVQTMDWPGTPETSPAGTTPMFYSATARDVDQRAVFGEISYDLTEQFTASVGGRYFKYDKSERSLLEGGFAGGIPIGAGTAELTDRSQDGDSLKANLSYRPTKDALLYATWAEGFRLGRPAPGLIAADCDIDNNGLVDGTNVSIESTRKIDSDNLENYEIGGKFAFFDRRMTVDVDVYHIDWQGLPILVQAEQCSQSYTANAGAAESEGVEFQARLIVTDRLTVDFGGGYTKAQLTEDALNLNAQAGDRLPGSAKVSANLAAQYDFTIAGYDGFVRADSFYTGKFYGDLQESPDAQAGNYTKIDARTGLKINDLSIELFVRNLTDERALTYRTVAGGVNPSTGYRLRPRTVGIQLGYSFE